MPTDPSTGSGCNFTQIVFNASTHSYTYHGQPLTSVSRTIGQLKPPFDREGIAARTAAKTGQTVTEILAEWDHRSQVAMARGTRVHEWIAQSLRGELPIQADMFLALNQRLPEMDAFEKFWANPQVTTEVTQVEWVIGDEELGIAGTVDCVLLGADILHIFDWKTGKFVIQNRFQKLLPPFNDLDDCELVNYSLQLSLYRLIIERNTSQVLGDSYIVHLMTDGTFWVHPALDLRGRLIEWLTTADKRD